MPCYDDGTGPWRLVSGYWIEEHDDATVRRWHAAQQRAHGDAEVDEAGHAAEHALSAGKSASLNHHGGTENTEN